MRILFPFWLACVFAFTAANSARAEGPKHVPPHDPYRLGGLTGGSLDGSVRTRVDGAPLEGVDDNQLDGALDLRAYASFLPYRFLALSGYTGYTNWQSSYLVSAGHKRSNFFSVGAYVEVRIPFGRCQRCPSWFIGPAVHAALSLRDQRAPAAIVEEKGRFGWGYGFALINAIDVPFHRRFGARFQMGFERTILHHHVELGNLGSQNEQYQINRVSLMLGPWFSL